MKKLDCELLGRLCEFLLDGEPVFVIRAQDVAAGNAIADYIATSRDHGGKNLGRAQSHLERVVEWQKENLTRVRAAD